VPVETARDGFQVVITRHVVAPDSSNSRDLVLKSVYQPGRNVTLVGSGNAPDAGAVTAAIDRVHASMGAALAPAPKPVASPAPESTIETANGARTLTQIRDELRNAGWGGGSDQDAVATYKRLADAAQSSGH
jgi:hypothetical protein